MKPNTLGLLLAAGGLPHQQQQPSGGDRVHRVDVGLNARGEMALEYNPPVLRDVPVGARVEFWFNPLNHTVTQSSFDDPCSALDQGFTTGFVPVSTGALPTRKEFVVDKPGPLWFYCQQQQPQPHCQAGMVFAVNPGTTVGKDDFETFLDKANKAEGGGDGENAGGKTHVVEVGPDGDFIFVPPVIRANPGDQVEFRFNPLNHSVTQSSFDNPCSKILSPQGEAFGFDSDFMPVMPQGEKKIFKLKVNDTKPVFGYCKQGNGSPEGHCVAGMTFAVNPDENSPQNFGAFQAKAKSLVNVPAPKRFKVDVGVNKKGDAELVYTPPFIDGVKKGDIIDLKFNPANHTFTQSSLETPCTARDKGFSTDFVPVGVKDDPKLRSFVVQDDSKPLWFYCRQQMPTPHCQAGMVFGVNTQGKFEEFKANAAKQPVNQTTPSNLNSGAVAGVAVASLSALVGLSSYWARKRARMRAKKYAKVGALTAPEGEIEREERDLESVETSAFGETTPLRKVELPTMEVGFPLRDDEDEDLGKEVESMEY